MELFILIGVAMIDAKIWKLVLEQGRHNKAAEALLAKIRDELKPNARR